MMAEIKPAGRPDSDPYSADRKGLSEIARHMAFVSGHLCDGVELMIKNKQFVPSHFHAAKNWCAKIESKFPPKTEEGCRVKEPLWLIPVGTRIVVGHGSGSHGINGIVEKIMLEGESHVTYKVAWWDGRCRRSEWVEACEIERFEDGPDPRIGFYFGSESPGV